MDTLLTIIAILGLGALLISAYVFISAAKRYVTGEDLNAEMKAMQSDLSPYRHWVDRSQSDRRQNTRPTLFPITIDGELVSQDRRVNAERRQAA